MVRDGTLELRSEVHEVHTQTHRHMDTQTHGVRPLLCATLVPHLWHMWHKHKCATLLWHKFYIPPYKPKRKMKNALGANIILAQKSPQSGVIGVIGVYI